MLGVRFAYFPQSAGVLHMKDREQIIQCPQRQAPIHWENTRGLITAKMSEQLNQPAIPCSNEGANQESYLNINLFFSIKCVLGPRS